MDSHFLKYVDLEIILVFDSGVKIKSQASDPSDLYNYCLNYFPIESFFWPSVACIVENRKIDLEIISRSRIDSWINFDQKGYSLIISPWLQSQRSRLFQD